MSIETYVGSRDSGLKIRRYEFRFGPHPLDYFAFTDSPVDHRVETDGNSWVYFSVDRSSFMASRNRWGLARSAVIRALNSLKDQKAADPTRVFNVGVQVFAEAQANQTRMNATTTQIQELINWLNAQDTINTQADYANAVQDPIAWFRGAGKRAKFRTWVFVSGGDPDPGSVAGAWDRIAPLVTQVGSEEVGYIPTDIYPVCVGRRDTRALHIFRNTAHFPIETIESMDSPIVARRVNAVTRADMVYKSAPIRMPSVSTNGSPSANDELKLTIAKDNPLALYYRDQRVQRPMFLTIYEGQADDPEKQFRLEWTGKVMSSKRNVLGNEVELICQPPTISFKRNGLRRRYQRGCPHVLYGDLCKASLLAATVSFDPTGLPNSPARTITVPAGVLKTPTSRYRGGIVWWEYQGRPVRHNIVDVNGNTLMIDGPVDDGMATNRIYIALGCEHTFTFCDENHIDSETGDSNAVNFGGQNRIPSKDPFRFVSNYY